MKKIELEQWEPFPGDHRRMQYAGQRVAQEVFEELKHRLESMGYLPDEYFLMDREWENGREIPKDADIFCTTDYGGSEGVQFLLDKGAIDMIVDRRELRDQVARTLALLLKLPAAA